jgi:hypothetical protein
MASSEASGRGRGMVRSFPFGRRLVRKPERNDPECHNVIQGVAIRELRDL